MINRAAVLHIPLSQYAFANSEHSLTIRLRTAKDDLKSCRLHYGDRASKISPVQFLSADMHVTGHDQLYDYYEATINNISSRICYYFHLEQKEETIFYYADMFQDELADIRMRDNLVDGRNEYYQYPFILREEVPDVPGWFKEAIVYNIFPDSFADGKRTLSHKGKDTIINKGDKIFRSRLGGTINGIRDNLDYIRDLGFNCIYLNPIFCAGEYHKYDLIDYYHVDPGMGTDDDFYALTEELHRYKMRIIIDGVFNHCGWDFFAFEDVIHKQQKSKYCDWFYDLRFPVEKPKDGNSIPPYACFGYERKMPKLNTSNPQVIRYFSDVGRYWIKKFKVDGWRLDVAAEVSRDFWHNFRKTVKNQNPEAVLIGEVWENAETWLRGDIFDSTMNYDFRNHCRDFFAFGKIDAETFNGRMTQLRLRYPANIVKGQLNLLDSHDTPRFLSFCDKDIRCLRQALLFLMLFPGVPCVFYGDEKGISGLTEREYRKPMQWGEEKYGLETFLRKIIALRKYEAMLHGDYKTISAEPGSGLYGIYRTCDRQTIWAYFNTREVVEKIPIVPSANLILEQGYANGELSKNGFAVFRAEKQQPISK